MERIYIGKTCPYCKTSFQKDDVVVFCSVCNMPHHLSCWQANEGCTTFGCTGLIDTIINQDKAHAVSYSQPGIAESANAVFPLQESVKPKQDGPRFETLLESSEGKLQDGTGILIEKVALIKDHDDDSIFARCSFRSLTEKPIKALLLDISAVDVWGKPIQGVEGFQLLDLKTKRDAVFGQTTPIPMPDNNTRGVDVVIKKILFEDRSMVDCPETFSNIALQQSLADYFGDSDMAAEYVRETSENSKYVPCQGEKIWRCSCGAINDNDSGICYKCSADKEKLLSAVNPEQIKINADRYLEEKRLRAEAERREREERQREAEERLRKAQEEKQRQDREAAEKKRARGRKIRKRVVGSILGVILLAAVVYGAGWHLIPFIRYSAASSNVEKCNFDAAYDTYVALGDYKDSSRKAIETVYAKGEYLIGLGRYAEAAYEFDRIPNYQDSKSKAVYCRNEVSYLLGIDKFNAREYDDAAKIFTELGEYSDASDWVNKTNYAHAGECFEKGDYEKAFELFTDLKDYEDSEDQAKESKFMMAEKAFAAKDFEKAYIYYYSLKDYKGSSEKSKESQYLFACYCMDRGKYKEASDAFGSTNLEGYKESAVRYMETSYLYAKNCYDSKNYADAVTYFAKIPGYEDADALLKDSKYENALNLISDKKYTQAVYILQDLGNYKESKAKLNEAKYAYVISHKYKDNVTTYSYLKDLKAAKYEDAASIYKQLYAWKATITAINDSEDSKVNRSSLSRYDTWVFHFILEDGPPSGDVLLRYKLIYPDGSSSGKEKFNEKFSRGQEGMVSVWYTHPAYGDIGYCYFYVYDDEGNEIGSDYIRITY